MYQPGAPIHKHTQVRYPRHTADTDSRSNSLRAIPQRDRMPSKRHALSPRHFSFLLVAVLWGTTWTAIKVSLQGYPPFVGATLRFVAAIAILTFYARLMRISLTLPR